YRLHMPAVGAFPLPQLHIRAEQPLPLCKPVFQKDFFQVVTFDASVIAELDFGHIYDLSISVAKIVTEPS
ncbi:MAG: hypothetical protein Q8S44_05300, partial [Flavobacteriaceae bacterium]|nr:hypothetical protein [Flavobacteriaceae bacterium]